MAGVSLPSAACGALPALEDHGIIVAVLPDRTVPNHAVVGAAFAIPKERGGARRRAFRQRVQGAPIASARLPQRPCPAAPQRLPFSSRATGSNRTRLRGARGHRRGGGW